MPEPKGIYPKYVVFKHPDFIPDLVEAVAYRPRKEEGGFIPPELLLPIRDFVFVLKPVKDHHARVAIAAYAQSVMKDKPQLGEELMQVLSDGP